MSQSERKSKKWRNLIILISGALAGIIAVYALYVILAYHRIEDQLSLAVNARGSGASDTVSVGKEYTITSYNIGFGAYTPEFSFFMDGGKSSVAESKESVIEAVSGAASVIQDLDPDFSIWQEVDLDATRSYHVNQREMLDASFSSSSSDFAVNYDSAFLMVPPWEPHGKSLAGIAFYSKFSISSALRRSFPVSAGFNKFLDLDRCYSVSRIPVDNGKELCIYSIHMSAYGNDASIREGQISMLTGDMRLEREAGNYVICGGDFNHDLKNTGSGNAKTESWAYPFPRESLPEGFTMAIDQVSADDLDTMPESARNADEPYNPDTTYQVTLDGFIFSDNVIYEKFQIIDTQFRYSDHNPVLLSFQLRA